MGKMEKNKSWKRWLVSFLLIFILEAVVRNSAYGEATYLEDRSAPVGGVSRSARSPSVEFFSIAPETLVDEVMLDSVSMSDAVLKVSYARPISAMSVSANVKLRNPRGYARIILTDTQGTEHLIFGSDSMALEGEFGTKNICEETCILDRLQVKHIAVSLKDASMTLHSLYFQRAEMKGISDEAIDEWRAKQELQKTVWQQERIKNRGLRWTARSNDISRKRYREKKVLFPNGLLPNLQGFDYYGGGIFELDEESPRNYTGPQPGSSSWDWRNVHGENWLTSIKNQVGYSCWAFSLLGTMESQINLYYNQHLDLDLSEQQIIDCQPSRDLPLGMNYQSYAECNQEKLCSPGYNYCVIKYHGIADENCAPTAAFGVSTNCNLVCTDWESRSWKVAGFHDYKFVSDQGTPECRSQTMNPTEEDFKRVLVTRGPLDSGIISWRHAMVLVGYNKKSDWKTVRSCEFGEMCNSSQECIPIECSQEGEEKTICAVAVEVTPPTSYWHTYECQSSSSNEPYRWKRKSGGACQPGQSFVADCCQNGPSEPIAGQRTCSARRIANDTFQEVVEYTPGLGEIYWIFKNSWGTTWGSAGGYARVVVSLENMGWGSLPLGPYTPPSNHANWPAGFDGTINCVDKDGDSYCNWGLSEIRPSTCPAFCKPEKDCNDNSAALTLLDANYNCLMPPPRTLRVE